MPHRPPPEAFAAIRQGIHLVRWGVSSALFFAVVCVLGQLMAANQSDADLHQLAQAVWIFGATYQIGSALVIVLGVCFSCVVPKSCAARKWTRCIVPFLIVGGLLLLGSIAVAVAFFRTAWYSPTIPPQVQATLFTLAVLAVVGFFVSLFYFLLLADLARFFGDSGLAKRLTAFYFVSLPICGVTLLGTLMAIVITGEAMHADPSGMPRFVGNIAACAWLAPDFVLTLWLLALLRRLYRLLPTTGEPETPHRFPLIP